jgi:hypothetical protein
VIRLLVDHDAATTALSGFEIVAVCHSPGASSLAIYVAQVAAGREVLPGRQDLLTVATF